MNKIRVGLIGFGLSGKYFHASLLKNHPGFDVVAVCSSRADEVQSFLPQAQVVESARDLISYKDVDLVVNCAPNRFHYEYSAASLEQGKHVVVEKPFANSVLEAERLIELAEKNRRILSVYQNRRWDADFLTIQKLLREGRLGDIKQFESHMDRWRPTFRSERWRERAGGGSGTFFDLAPHLIDQTLTLFGPPQKIYADIERQKPEAETDDYFHLVFHYEKMRAILHSTSFAADTPRFQVFGDRASYVKFGMDPQEDQLKRGMSPSSPEFGQEARPGVLKFEEQSEELSSLKGNYMRYYDLLHAAITEGGANPVLPQEALQTMRILELVASGGLFAL